MVCWTPGLVLLLLDGLKCNCYVLKVEKFCLVLAEFNSLMNPLIYSYRDQDMRLTFKRILCCACFGRGRGSQHAGVRFNALDQEVQSESNGSNNTHQLDLKSSTKNTKSSKR